MQHKNFKNIDKVTYGRGSFAQLAETVEPIRKENKNYFVYVVDNYFKGKYCVENVIPYYEPLIPAQKRGRHYIGLILNYLMI